MAAGRWAVGSADGFCVGPDICSRWHSHCTLSSFFCRRVSAFWSVIRYSVSRCPVVFCGSSDGRILMV